METTRERFEKMLVNNCMFEDDAKKVMDIAIPIIDDVNPDYHYTWDRPADEYPQPIYNILFFEIKKIALKYIEENCPMAWYKPLFE